MKTLVIQLDRSEDIGSIRDKVTWGKASRVLLVWPVNFSMFNRKVDLTTIKRICTSQGSRLGIVCDDPLVCEEAEELQIPMFDSVTRAMRKGWDRRRKKKSLSLPTPRFEKSRIIEDLRTIPEREPKTGGIPRFARYILLAGGILSTLMMALFLIPSAKVSIYPLAQEQELKVVFLVEKRESGAPNPGILPGEVVKTTVEAEATRVVTGTTPIADQKARGKISAINRSGADIEIPAQTIVMNNATPPVRFRTMQNVIVPVGATLGGIEIEAIYGGETGNCPPNTVTRIDGELGLQLELSNPEQITGGTDRQAPSPSEEDIQILKMELKDRLSKAAEKQLSASLNPDEILLTSSITPKEVISEKITPEIGQVGINVNVFQKIEFTALIIRQDNLQKQAKALLDANRANKDWALSSSSPVDIQILDQKYSETPEIAKLTTRIKGRTIPPLDIEKIRRSIAGTGRATAQAILAVQVLSERTAEIETWPVWFPYLPWLESRITIILP
ncbi:MAG: hypothetical protein GYA15_01685 [Leptolinea sp.]|jgi:hypothetical protein|nr:hypothetical protein [Leptolinea sp.]